MSESNETPPPAPSSRPDPAREPASQPETAASAESREAGARRGVGVGGAFLIGLLSAGIVGGALALTAPHWLPLLPPARPAAQEAKRAAQAALEARLEALDEQIRQVQGEQAELVRRLEDLPAPAVEAGESAQQHLQRQEQAIDRLSADTTRLDQALAALAARVEAIPRDAPPAQGAADPELAPRLEQLEKSAAEAAAQAEQLRALREAQGGAANEVARLSDRLGKVEDRIGKLEQAAATLQAGEQRGLQVSRATALVVAAARLRQALESGAPYAGELSALAPLAEGNEAAAAALKTLEPQAATGIPSLPALRAGFADMARLAVAADTGAAEPDWIDQALGRLKQIVSVRRTGADVPGDSAEAVIARAEAELAAGRLAAAVDGIARLGGRPAEAASAWLAQARTRLAAIEAVDRLAAEGSAQLTRASRP